MQVYKTQLASLQCESRGIPLQERLLRKPHYQWCNWLPNFLFHVVKMAKLYKIQGK